MPTFWSLKKSDLVAVLGFDDIFEMNIFLRNENVYDLSKKPKCNPLLIHH